MDHEVHHPVAVARFVVTPGLSLIKVFIEGNASTSVKVGSVGVTVKIIGDRQPGAQYSLGCPLVGPLMPASSSS